MKRPIIIGAAATLATAAVSAIALAITNKKKDNAKIEPIQSREECESKTKSLKVNPYFVISDAYNRRVVISPDGCIERYENENLVSSDSIEGWPIGNFIISVAKTNHGEGYWLLFTNVDGASSFVREELESCYYSASHIMRLSPRLEVLPLYDKTFKNSRSSTTGNEDNCPIVGHDCMLAVYTHEPGNRILPSELMFFGDGDTENTLTVVDLDNNVYCDFDMSEFVKTSRRYHGAGLLLESKDGYALVNIKDRGSNLRLNRYDIKDIDDSHNYERFVANIENCERDVFDVFYASTSTTM